MYFGVPLGLFLEGELAQQESSEMMDIARPWEVHVEKSRRGLGNRRDLGP